MQGTGGNDGRARRLPPSGTTVPPDVLPPTATAVPPDVLPPTATAADQLFVRPATLSVVFAPSPRLLSCKWPCRAIMAWTNFPAERRPEDRRSGKIGCPGR